MHLLLTYKQYSIVLSIKCIHAKDRHFTSHLVTFMFNFLKKTWFILRLSTSKQLQGYKSCHRRPIVYGGTRTHDLVVESPLFYELNVETIPSSTPALYYLDFSYPCSILPWLQLPLLYITLTSATPALYYLDFIYPCSILPCLHLPLLYITLTSATPALYYLDFSYPCSILPWLHLPLLYITLTSSTPALYYLDFSYPCSILPWLLMFERSTYIGPCYVYYWKSEGKCNVLVDAECCAWITT